ncbi:MAG TPA: NHL repeat-containing protein [Candidatus Acidoferrales bacterium]|nr:NHL repeat-containing protein [Candidatus Acidoferrales bacterium]
MAGSASGNGFSWLRHLWFLSVFAAAALLLARPAAVAAQQSASVVYFANDEIRLAKLLERTHILEYRVVLAGERRLRETYLDAEDLALYRRGMFYRVRESFAGPARLELYQPASATDRPGLAPLRSVALAADRTASAREGKIEDQNVLKPFAPALGGREVKSVQLVAEYASHGVSLERNGKREFTVSLLVGSFEGFSGRRLKKLFWAVEVEAVAKRLAPAHAREVKRIVESLIPELKLNPRPKSMYAQGIERAVLLRENERLIRPVRLVGGSRGSGIEQFNLPDAVGFTLDGKLVAGDTDNARFKIYSFDETGQTVRVVGREGSAPGEFDHSVAASLGSYKIYHQVQGIAVDRDGVVYVIDQGNRRVQAFDAEGKVLPDKTIQLSYCAKETPRCADGLWQPSRKGEYTSPQGLATDHEGAVFLSDKGMSRIYRFVSGRLDPNFNLPELDSTTGKPILQEPESLAVHRDRLFVANEGAGDIKIFDRRTGKPAGGASGFGGGVFAGDVEGLAVVNDYLFAVDVQNSRIAVFDLRHETPAFLAGLVGDFESADGIAVDPTGKYVAVADQGNARVLLFSLREILNHLASLRSGG